MNPMTNVKNIQKLNEKVLQMGVEDDVSWHKQYKDSAYVFLGGLPYDLTEGDILCVFSQHTVYQSSEVDHYEMSQRTIFSNTTTTACMHGLGMKRYGEIVDVNLVRDKSSGKFKGYGFLCYEDQRSTILAVDNLNGIKLGDRTIRVDHVANYKRPKGDERDEKGERKDLPLVGCAPTTPPGSDEDPDEEENDVVMEPKKKKKKKEKSKKRTKEKKKSEKGEVEERARSPSAERWKIGRDDKELGGRTKTLGNTSEMDRDRKRYRDERSYGDRMNVDSYKRHDYKEKDRETDMREDVKYKGNIEERMKYRRDNERGRDKDTERRRYEDRNRK